jgi:hypothetical protein
MSLVRFDQRCAECPDPDASYLSSMEFNFSIPVWLTQDQQRQLHDLLDEIVDAPWNEPVDGCHWLAEWGAKPQWREPQEPTFNDSVLQGQSCARGFVSEAERDRKLAERQKPPRENPRRDTAIDALETVMNFWLKDPKAFGDDATLGSIAVQFEKVARKCQRALAILRAEKMKDKE